MYQRLLFDILSILVILKEEMMYQKILVPLDGSDLAEVARPHAESLALKYDAELILPQPVGN
jgi:nucleotide-binding universal stress UspA family protein